MRALDGARVVELGHYVAGPLCGLLLAEQGADVVHISPEEGERWPNPANAYLNRSKRTIRLDLRTSAGRQRASDLVSRADVIVDNFRPGVLARLGIVAANDLGDRVWLSLPGFSSADPRSGDRAWEGILGAATGLFTDVHVTRQVLGLPPVFSALPLASSYGAVHGALAVVAALHRRTHTGTGARLEVPLADALFAAFGSIVMRVPNQPARYDIPPVSRVVRDAVLPVVRWFLRGASSVRRARASNLARGLVPPLMDSYRCADGRLLYVFAMDHDTIVSRLAAVIGARAELERLGFVIATGASPRVGSDLRDPARLTRGRRAQLREVLARAFATRPARNWEVVLADAGVPAAMQRSAAEWLDWEPAREAELVVHLSDPELGFLEAPGPAVVVGEPAVVTPRVFADSADVLAGWPARTVGFGSTGPFSRPYEGLRVVDISSMVAGPICARTLGEYGAEVWKVDAPTPHHGPRMTRWYGIEVNQGKRATVLDLGSAPDRRRFDSLLAKADLLVHNLRPEARGRLDLDDVSLKRAHPHLSITRISAYEGPKETSLRSWPGYDPVLQAATGIMTRYGSSEEPELHAIASCVDYVTGYLAAYGSACALFRRRINPSSTPPVVRVSLAQGAAIAQAGLLLRVDGETPVASSGQEAMGRTRFDRMYETLDGFVYVVLGEVAARRLVAGDAEGRGLVSYFARLRLDEAVDRVRAAGGNAEPVKTAADAPSTRLEQAADSSLLPSLAVITQSHPVGCEVTTVYPTYVRATPSLIHAPSPAPAPAADQAALSMLLDDHEKDAPYSYPPPGPYLPA